MDYKETLNFLALRGNEVSTIHLGLHRTAAMVEALGNPQNRYRTIHIAGTNGKGSVAAMAESILREAGLVTGLYTSPHLVRVEERMRVNGRQISPFFFAWLATRVRETEAALLKKGPLDRPLTTFEYLTCCAFLCFAEKKVDIAVIEVGLGGKLDSTNVITPQVSVVTGIALDHQYLLGNTLTKIAGEKAGIIKENVPAVSGCCDPAPRRVIQRRAREVHAPLTEACQACKTRIAGERQGRFTFDLQTPVRKYRGLRLSLAGEYQVRNATLAVLAIEALGSAPIKMRDIRRGLAQTRWPGRLDEYRCRRRTLLDGAHNPEGALLLRDFLLRRKEKEIHMVFGAVRDKDIRKIGAAVFPVATRIHLTPLVNTRSADPAEVAAMHKSFRPKMRIHRNMREALLAAWEECPRSGLVVVTGSLYLVGDLLPFVVRQAASGHN
jgi:dihydrofolate synthase / folylpolyglutamate synthase